MRRKMIPAELKYHSEHEWIRMEGKTAVLGITDYAQEALGDVVFLELPASGSLVKAGEEIGEVESTKTTSAIYTPVSGKIIEVNEALKDKPELVNKEPYGQGWIIRIEVSNANEIQQLMDAKQYEAFLKEESF
jgi:glycine cleavage system H protein